jgi:Na+-translocating ferredoxin:NAD+ oxidoreductase subunit B
MEMADNDNKKTRREFMRGILRNASLAAMGGLVGLGLFKGRVDANVWQIDPAKCTYCGKCATDCVLEESAVKCVNSYDICGYCRICFGFFEAQPAAINEGAENQRCPMGAIRRTYVEEPYYEYTIDESLCIGCARCVNGCTTFGNGSFYLQVRHDRCVHCNQCAIALACPPNAFQRVPAKQSYMFKKGDNV